MAKKKRDRKKRNKTVYLVIEGKKREAKFIDFLSQLYKPKENGINITRSPISGGSPDYLINEAIKNCYYNKVYVWFDEDKPIENNDNFRIFERLKKAWSLDEDIDPDVLSRELQYKVNTNNKNPIFIVSTPLSVEGVLIRLFEKRMPDFIEPYLADDNIEENKKRIKDAVSGIFQKIDELEYYKINLTKEILEEKSSEIEELKLLLSIFQ